MRPAPNTAILIIFPPDPLPAHGKFEIDIPA
jgi:hypothetical protein